MRILRTLAVLSAVVAVCAGCVVTPYTFTESRGRTLTVWSYIGEAPSLPLLVEQFRRTHPDVDVRFVSVPIGSFGPKLVAAAGQQRGPDVVIGNPVADFPLLTAGGCTPT